MTVISYSVEETFDKVKTHLLTQKAKAITSFNGQRCVYRNADGLKCAIGCLIPDDVYRPWLERYNVAALCQGAKGKRGEDVRLHFYKTHPDEQLTTKEKHRIEAFVTELQLVHDTVHPDKWDEELRRIHSWFSDLFDKRFRYV